MLVMVTGMMCDVDIDDDGMMKSKYYKYVFTDIDNSFWSLHCQIETVFTILPRHGKLTKEIEVYKTF